MTTNRYERQHQPNQAGMRARRSRGLADDPRRHGPRGASDPRPSQLDDEPATSRYDRIASRVPQTSRPPRRPLDISSQAPPTRIRSIPSVIDRPQVGRASAFDSTPAEEGPWVCASPQDPGALQTNLGIPDRRARLRSSSPRGHLTSPRTARLHRSTRSSASFRQTRPGATAGLVPGDAFSPPRSLRWSGRPSTPSATCRLPFVWLARRRLR